MQNYDFKGRFNSELSTQLGLNKLNMNDYQKESKDPDKEIGRIGKNQTLEKLSKKHKVDLEILEKELKKGIEVEKEHTKKIQIAKKIAMDHLTEDPKYYTKLKKMETKEEWSKKYKDSIDCKNPKGFSQKAHCQGKKKKSEAKEATGSGSAGGYESIPLFSKNKIEAKEATSSGAGVGAYETPSIWAKSLNKKDWRGASKTQIPGGKFVQVKKKCKKFPYCNQGDIKALKIFENEKLNKVIKRISEKHKIHPSIIQSILYEHLMK